MIKKENQGGHNRMTSITYKIYVLIEMIGSSPELGPIMAGTHLLKRREVD